MKDDKDTFDYILRIPIYNLTIDKVEELEDEYSRISDALDILMKTDIKDIWKGELQELKNLFDSYVTNASNDTEKKKRCIGTLGRKKKDI